MAHTPEIQETKKYIAHNMLTLVWVVFLFNTLAQLFHWYWIFWWFDMPMHFLGGMFVGFLVLYTKPRLFIGTTRKALFLFFFYSLCIGVGWELLEISMDIFIKHSQTNIIDTFSDIGFDLAGAGVTYLVLLYRNPIRKE